MFSVHTKTKSQCFQIPRFQERFKKSSVFVISVDGKSKLTCVFKFHWVWNSMFLKNISLFFLTLPRGREGSKKVHCCPFITHSHLSLSTFTLWIHCLTESCSILFADRCNIPLGLEDKRVTPGALTASTYYNHHLSPWHGRLNHRWSWSVRLRRIGQYLQVNFVELMRIKGVATQGRQDANQWVRSYTVSYSTDGMNFVSYKEGRTTKVNKLFVPPVVTRTEVIIRVIIIDHKHYSLDSEDDFRSGCRNISQQ